MRIPQQLPYILSTADFFLTPLYIIILFIIVKKLKKKHYSNSPLQRFILPGFFIHVIGSVFFALIIQYYYGYADTYGYYTGAHETWEAFLKNPKVAFELIFVNRENFSQTAIDWAPYSAFTGFAESLSYVVKIAGFVGLFCFGTYIPIALIFGLFSFWGTWLIYITINKYFPHLFKYTAIACLFIPSVVIWSSGISKEAPCIFALGVCFYSIDKIIHGKGLVKHILYLCVGAMTLIAIKSYIFFTFAFAAFIWVFCFFIMHIKNYLARIIVRSIIVLGIVAFCIYFIAVPENILQQSFKDALEKGEHLQEMMTLLNETYGGSGYTLPPVDFSIGGFIQSFFLSLNVTLFRPYIWECTNVLMIMNFMESFATLVLALIVLFKAGIRKIISYCNKFPVLFFMLVFSLLFAPIVGFISFNFGTLVRYKIPFLPFFITFLVIILFDKKNDIPKKNLA